MCEEIYHMRGMYEEDYEPEDDLFSLDFKDEELFDRALLEKEAEFEKMFRNDSQDDFDLIFNNKTESGDV